MVGLWGSTGAVDLSYMRRVSEKTGFGVELKYMIPTRDVTAQIGWEYAVRQTAIKGTFGSDLTISTTIEERIAPNMGMLFSAMLDHSKSEHKFGIGAVFG